MAGPKDGDEAAIAQELKDISEGGKQLHFSFWSKENFGLLTEDELASVLGVMPLTLAKWRRDGRGPAFLRPGKTVFYRRQDVDLWLQRNVRMQDEQAA